MLLALLSAVFDASWYLHRRAMVAEAAQVGARAASVAYDVTELDATAAEAATRRLTTLGVDPAGAVIVTTLNTTGVVDAVEVDVTVAHTPIMGFIPVLQSIHCHASVAYEDPGS